MDNHPTTSSLRALPEAAGQSFANRFLPRLSFTQATLVALLAIGLAVTVRLIFAEELGQRATFIFFVPGVVVASALSSFRAGTFAAVTGALAGLACDRLNGPVESGSMIAAATFVLMVLSEQLHRPVRGRACRHLSSAVILNLAERRQSWNSAGDKSKTDSASHLAEKP